MRNILALFLLALLVFVAIELARSVDLPFLSGEEAWGCPFPETLRAVSREFGGSQEDWYKSAEYSYTYQGHDPLTFRIPDGCDLGGARAGVSVSIAKGDTYTWKPPT